MSQNTEKDATASDVKAIVKYTIKPLAWNDDNNKPWISDAGYYIDTYGTDSFILGWKYGDMSIHDTRIEAMKAANEHHKEQLLPFLEECT